MKSDSALQHQAPFWAIWANPIVRRYARSRMRPRALGISLLVTLMIAGFLFFVIRQLGIYQAELSIRDAHRMPIIPLLFFQGFILFVLGSGQTAAGMTAEADEGVIDYQRLTPMTPLAKVVGYLFGLPIREYVTFLATMPFTLWAFWRGEVPLHIGLQLYGVFMIAGVLYHLTGLVAGTVLKNRRWAFLSSMGLVFALYTVVPQASKLGLVYFKYVTIEPVVRECLPYLVESKMGAAAQTMENFAPAAQFFNLNFPQSVFTAGTLLFLIGVMVVMLWRRWHRAESHLMGKAGATGLFAWIQLMLLGNALPLIEPSGRVFPSRGARLFRLPGDDWSPSAEETLVMSGIYGLVTLMILWLMTVLITPDRTGQIRGWRRTRKLGRPRLSFQSDPATSFPWVFAMAALGSGGWFWFTKKLVESAWFGTTDMPIAILPVFFLVTAVGGFGFHALLEGKGKRAAGLAVILIGIAPLLVGVTVGATGEALGPLALWISGCSPVAGPIYAVLTFLPLSNLPPDFERTVPRAFWFWQGVGLLWACNLAINLLRGRKKIAESTL